MKITHAQALCAIRVRGNRIPQRSMKKIIDVTFESVEDFRRRIITLWQNQKEDEIYNFIFLDEQAEKEFEQLLTCFDLK